MELPVYHVPHLKTLLIQTWQRLKGFVIRAGKVIVVASMFIGALNSFPFQENLSIILMTPLLLPSVK